MDNFRKNLSRLDWENVMDSDDVDTTYEHFWDSFQTFYNLNFPEIKKKFNINYHKINGYMTRGLLTSRITKLNLLKKSINEPTNVNVNAYKNFRTIYNKTLRASRKLYFDVNFQHAKKNPKKTWDLIREAIGTEPSHPKINKLTISGKTVNDPEIITNEFNKFFVNAGKHVAAEISKTTVVPESFIQAKNTPLLEFSNTSPGEIVDIIKGFQSKTSSDIDGISMKLLKVVAIEISSPLAHIFNLSLKKGIFPSALKLSRVVPIHKSW